MLVTLGPSSIDMAEGFLMLENLKLLKLMAPKFKTFRRELIKGWG